jgi:hypothetical protein
MEPIGRNASGHAGANSTQGKPRTLSLDLKSPAASFPPADATHKNTAAPASKFESLPGLDAQLAYALDLIHAKELAPDRARDVMEDVISLWCVRERWGWSENATRRCAWAPRPGARAGLLAFAR